MATASARGLGVLIEGSGATPLITYTATARPTRTDNRASPHPSPGTLAGPSPGTLAGPSPGPLAVMPGTRFPPHTSEIVLKATFDPCQLIGGCKDEYREKSTAPPLLTRLLPTHPLHPLSIFCLSHPLLIFPSHPL